MSWWKRLFGMRSSDDEIEDTDDDFGEGLTCRNCGHVQQDGAWEKEMGRRARAMGTRFVNLSASPQCLSCGSTDLHNPLDETPEEEIDPKVEDWCRELREWSDRYYAGEQTRAAEAIRSIGRNINTEGGEERMAEVYWAIKHPPTQRNVNGCWGRPGACIGTWSFSKYD